MRFPSPSWPFVERPKVYNLPDQYHHELCHDDQCHHDKYNDGQCHHDQYHDGQYHEEQCHRCNHDDDGF